MLDFILTSLIELAQRKGYLSTQFFLTELKEEPGTCIKKILLFPLGWLPWFHFYGLNPNYIPKKLQQKPPILFLHGNYSNQSTVLELAKHLQNKYAGPVFTVNLHSGNFCAEDFEIIENKVAQIKELYPREFAENFKVHIVGHSRGAGCAYFFSIHKKCWVLREAYFDYVAEQIEFRKDVGRVIMIGGGKKPAGYASNSYAFMSNKFLSIEGRADRSLCLKEEQTLRVAASHSNTVRHPEVLHKIGSFFNDSSFSEDLSGTVENTEVLSCPVQ